MRPLNLTMQAFGAFKDKVEINFENLGQENIYLISGITGSGKTTIFDAICYALFNSSSGTNRGNQTLRSHFASDDTKSYVEFEFLFNNEKYKALRQPSYERKKSRGEGNILEQAKAELHLPSGKIIEKTKEVDEYIENLLGINVSQFSQIALLAQGEFLKILNSDTQTRGDIFRNIFKTWSYANFQNKLKDESLSLKNDYENSKNSILQYISDIIALDSPLKELKEKYLKNDCFEFLDELIELLQKQNKNDSDLFKKYKKEIENIEKNINKLRSSFQLIQQKTSYIGQIKEINSLIKIQTEEFKIAENEYQNLEKIKKEQEKITLEIKKVDEDYKKSLEIKELNKADIEFKKQLELKNKENLLYKKELQSLKENYLKYAYNTLLKLEEELKDKQDNFLELKSETEKLSFEYCENHNKYLSMQAGIIAKTLEENKPCPVCGSKKHPSPAKLNENNLTKEYLDELKNNLADKNNILNALAQNCSGLIEKINAQKSNYNNLLKEFETKIEEKKENIENADFENEIKKINQKISTNQKDIDFISSQIKENQAKIELLSRDIIDNIDEILINHEKLLKLQNDIEEKIKNIENSYISKNINLNNSISKLEILNKQLKELENVNINDFENISKEIKQNEEQIQNIDSSIQEILLRKGINNNIFDLLKEKNKEHIKLSNKYLNYKYSALHAYRCDHARRTAYNPASRQIRRIAKA